MTGSYTLTRLMHSQRTSSRFKSIVKPYNAFSTDDVLLLTSYTSHMAENQDQYREVTYHEETTGKLKRVMKGMTGVE